MPHTTALQAAQLLWQHWQAGSTLENLPENLRPATRAAGYAVQAALPQASGRSVRGWKIAATSAPHPQAFKRFSSGKRYPLLDIV